MIYDIAKQSEASDEAFRGGWFLSWDLAAIHPAGYVEIKDRSKDIIISGGENISSVEVENVIYMHPDVEEVALVGVPDKKWGRFPRHSSCPSQERTRQLRASLNFAVRTWVGLGFQNT